MRRQIEIENDQLEVTAFKDNELHRLRVGDGELQTAQLFKVETDLYRIELDGHSETFTMVVKGETAYIRAFNRNFTLKIIDPVEQAQQTSGGRSGSARAPMPGVVVEIHVKPGDEVVRGQPLMTIESMKILTVIKSPRNGEVEQVHLETGQTFEKNTVLVLLTEEREN